MNFKTLNLIFTTLFTCLAGIACSYRIANGKLNLRFVKTSLFNPELG